MLFNIGLQIYYLKFKREREKKKDKRQKLEVSNIFDLYLLQTQNHKPDTLNS